MDSLENYSSVHALRPFGFTQKWVLLTDTYFKEVGDEIVRLAPDFFEPVPIQWERFPDGTPNIHLNPARLEGRDVVLLISHHGGTLTTFSVIYAIPRYSARTFTVIYPYFHTGTMERVQYEGEVATAKTLARMMSATPAPQVGDTNFIFFDLHALATRFYFSDDIKVLLWTAMPVLFKFLEKLKDAEDGKYPVIAFPDEGAKKRFGQFFDPAKFSLCTCMKTRVGDERRLVLAEGECKDRHCLIVDDLVQSGGTLMVAKDMLHSHGATKVSGWVTHAVFPNESYKKFFVENTAEGKKPFHRFMITDSVPLSAKAVKGHAPFEVLSLAEILAQRLVPRDAQQAQQSRL